MLRVRMNETKKFYLAQKPDIDDPNQQDLYSLVSVEILQLLKLLDGTVKILVEG